MKFLTVIQLELTLGREKFLATSDGVLVKPPKFFKRRHRELKLLQRRLSRKQKRSANYEKQRIKVARLHHHQVKIYETEELNSLVRWDTAEWKLPVQTICQGLRSLNLGKCRNPVREQPGNSRSDSWEAHTIIFDLVWEDVTKSNKKPF